MQMAKKTPPDTDTARQVVQSDPFAIRSFEQLLSLFDGGHFLTDLMAGLRDLQRDMIDHRAQFGPKNCSGQMALTIGFELGSTGDLVMSAKKQFTPPKPPGSKAAAYVDEDGNLSLMSPMMKRMTGPVRDVTPAPTPAADYDPDTGEIRDID